MLYIRRHKLCSTFSLSSLHIYHQNRDIALTGDQVSDSMSTHVTKADTSLFIKRSTQDMELNQPKQEHKPAAIHDDQNYDDMANDTPMEEPDDTNIKQEEPVKKTSLPGILTSYNNKRVA